jgi:predicted  nucleic acid-binding Zn-ribbon protein
MSKDQELAWLYQYQEVRRRQSKLEKELEQLFADHSLNPLVNKLTSVTGEMASCQEAISTKRKKMKEWEEERTGLRYRREESEKDLYGGKITAPKELTQLEKKIAEYRQAEERVEEAILQAMYDLEELEKKLAGLEKKEAGLNEELVQRRAELEEKQGALQDELAALEKEGGRLAALVSPEWMTRFERLRERMNGVVLAPVQDKTCGYCHVLVPAGILEKARQGGAPPGCENCGRLLVVL